MITLSATGAGRLGLQNYNAAPPLGNTTLVADVAYVRGIALRSIVLSGNGSAFLSLIHGSLHIAVCGTNATFTHIDQGFVLPRNVPLILQSSGGAGGLASITWDLL